MVVALIGGALISQQLLWTPITAINMTDIITNQFKMTNASFAGTDSRGEPFKIHAAVGRQEFGNPDVIYFDNPMGTITRISDGKKSTEHITADSGEYNRVTQILTMRGNIKIDSSDGSHARASKSGEYNQNAQTMTLRGDVAVDANDGNKIRTQELVIKL